MIRYTKGDTKPDLIFICEREGEPINFATRVPLRVDFRLRMPVGGILTRQASIIDAAAGEVMVAWGVGDLSQAGEMFGEVLITWSLGNVEHGADPIRFLVREEFNPQ